MLLMKLGKSRGGGGGGSVRLWSLGDISGSGRAPQRFPAYSFLREAAELVATVTANPLWCVQDLTLLGIYVQAIFSLRHSFQGTLLPSKDH